MYFKKHRPYYCFSCNIKFTPELKKSATFIKKNGIYLCNKDRCKNRDFYEILNEYRIKYTSPVTVKTFRASDYDTFKNVLNKNPFLNNFLFIIKMNKCIECKKKYKIYIHYNINDSIPEITGIIRICNRECRRNNSDYDIYKLFLLENHQFRYYDKLLKNSLFCKWYSFIDPSIKKRKIKLIESLHF